MLFYVGTFYNTKIIKKLVKYKICKILTWY